MACGGASPSTPLQGGRGPRMRCNPINPTSRGVLPGCTASPSSLSRIGSWEPNRKLSDNPPATEMRCDGPCEATERHKNEQMQAGFIDCRAVVVSRRFGHPTRTLNLNVCIPSSCSSSASTTVAGTGSARSQGEEQVTSGSGHSVRLSRLHFLQLAIEAAYITRLRARQAPRRLTKSMKWTLGLLLSNLSTLRAFLSRLEGLKSEE